VNDEVDGPAGPVVRVGGAPEPGCRLTMADLRALPQQEAPVVYSCRRSGPRHHVFGGPLLWDALALAGPGLGRAERKTRARLLISLCGEDGHQAVLSWAEIDPEFGGQAVLLAIVRDGAALDAEGPQLVVPGDRCGARNVSGVTDLRVRADPPS
jgi:hypothetical protein